MLPCEITECESPANVGTKLTFMPTTELLSQRLQLDNQLEVGIALGEFYCCVVEVQESLVRLTSRTLIPLPQFLCGFDLKPDGKVVSPSSESVCSCFQS